MDSCVEIINNVVVPLAMLNLIIPTAIGLVWLKKWCREERHESDDDDSSEEETEEDEFEEFKEPEPSVPMLRARYEDISDSDIITQVRNAVLNENGPPQSIESMTGNLISVTREIADALDGASNIPANKKRELANLLKGVPEFIDTITKMDDKELRTILSQNNRKVDPPTANTKSKPTDPIKESEFLMRTLDSLRA